MGTPPSVPTPRQEHAIAEAVAHGVTLSEAARALGLPDRTVRNWDLRGRHGEEPFARFADSIDAARAEHEANRDRLLANLRDRLDH